MPQIEEQIQKAIENGTFKDLPGKGKPLRLGDNPHQDPEWRLASHMLSSSGYTLPWIELHQEIKQEIERVRGNLKRAWMYYEKEKDKNLVDIQVSGEWDKALVTFRNDVEKLNKRIRDYNLAVPSVQFQFVLIDPEREINQITAH
jgi:DnaJ family protein C protein 28